MKKKLLPALSALAIVLEILPWGAVLVFANNEDAPRRLHFSYFDITPYGYANFGPFLCAMASVILTVTALIYWRKEKGLKFLRVMAGAAFVLSVMPVLYGFAFVSILGCLISLTLLAITVLSFWPEPPQKRKNKK